MGFVSFTGRLLSAFTFFLSAWQDINTLGYYGGSKMKYLRPRYEVYRDFLPNLEVKVLVAVGRGLKGMGGILFVHGSPIGAYLLLLYSSTTMPALIDFCSKPFDSRDFFPSFSQSPQELALSGALLFFLVMKRSIRRRQSKKRPLKAKSA